MSSWPSFPGVDPKVYESWRLSPDLRPLKEEVTGGVGRDLWILMAAIVVVLIDRSGERCQFDARANGEPSARICHAHGTRCSVRGESSVRS